MLCASALLPAVFYSGTAGATLFRGLPLSLMIERSAHIALLSGIDANCVYVQLAGRRSIVTETRVRVLQAVGKAAPKDRELVVRALGGVLDGVGELVHGQAEFAANRQCLAFLTRATDGSLWVTGMAQGHYPIERDAEDVPRLRPSPHLPSVIDFEHSAVRRLVGQTLPDAIRLVNDASRP